jgi:hypothetical protein
MHTLGQQAYAAQSQSQPSATPSQEESVEGEFREVK